MGNSGVKQSVSTMLRSKIDILKVLKILESGEDNVYLLSDDGRYCWQAIQSKDFRFELKDDGSYVISVSSLAPIVFNRPINDENNDLYLKACEEGFYQNPEAKELPVVRADGRIIASERRNTEEIDAIDWSKISKVKESYFKGKYYISSETSPKLAGLYDIMRDVADVEIMSEQNMREVLLGKSGTLIYGKDIYPDIPKISADEFYQLMLSFVRYDINQVALQSYEGFHLSFNNVDKPKEKEDFPSESCIKSFLSQVESDFPVLLLDAYDIEEITWICDKLRTTEKFGADNHLYLQYSSWNAFLSAMYILDWTYIIGTGKVVFLFSEEEKLRYYPTVADKGSPQKLDIQEINEIVHSIPRGFSGSDFFNMILDSHPSLLTIGWHGLPTFAALWKVFCEGKTVKEAVAHLKNPKDSKEISLFDYNLKHMLKYNSAKRLPIFFEELLNYLNPNEKYSMSDWFRAFYLASNATVNHKFSQRIIPAIFYDEHGANQLMVKNDFGISEGVLKKNLIGTFKYRRRVGIVRHPISRFGCQNNGLIKEGKSPVKGSWRSNPLAAVKAYSKGIIYGKYLKETDSELRISRQFRFEDLKLYPKETTEKLCEYLRIPWSETCLHITTNGEESGKVDGTKGFDTTPVYKRHSEYLSTFDCYRIELLNLKNFDVWGYKPKYYDGTRYTIQELEKLFSIPFKVENMKLPKWKGWPNEKESKEFHEWILARAIDVMKNGEKEPVDASGKPLKLVECLYPDLQPGQRLFEC